ncbi:hypothetical protein BDV25DRAFT_144439 [Aspergillus avenaceus]|uniref:Uncharacterized protein n=1 Tax=Aspergillus avenaceus TaxID=36643 RepID=A0A5N6TH60_ASPAV|nr:hypothetical protein BDV25DRAFT_144439 [Aspergillus avenaceus]
MSFITPPFWVLVHLELSLSHHFHVACLLCLLLILTQQVDKSRWLRKNFA